MNETIVILSISPVEADHDSLEQALRNSDWPLCPDSRWTLQRSRTLDAGLTRLPKNRTPIVVCDCDSLTGSWKDVLALLAIVANPPFLILTSRHADEHLWAEALNLGVYDVLAKPLDGKEVGRIFGLAWLNWKDQKGRAAKKSFVSRAQPSANALQLTAKVSAAG